MSLLDLQGLKGNRDANAGLLSVVSLTLCNSSLSILCP
jgi:hypothetical protein